MFGSSGSTKEAESTSGSHASGNPSSSAQSGDQVEGANKRSGGSSSPSGSKSNEDPPSSSEKKRRSSGVSKAKDMLSSAKQSLHLHSSSPTSTTDQKANASPLSKMGKVDPALSVPQGSLNNSAGESNPGPKSTFKVGVTEDRNKKCRRTMEDTHAYLYNFLSTPAPVLGSESGSKSITSIPESTSTVSEAASSQNLETDNGYFAIFDGHAGTFAADWCGKKLHLLLEDTIRKNPNKAIPELLDRTFTSVDQQLEKLPLKNSGCTAVIAVLRWEDRVPNSQSATGSSLFAPAAVAAVKAASESVHSQQNAAGPDESTPTQQATPSDAAASSNEQPQSSPQAKPEQATATEVKLRETATRQRVLYTANVGDARIVLCRSGRALRLSYDHKGSDENEGRRVANAGGLILNNRVNGVLAVTRALGDAYMKDLVTGHPYTTETVIQPDQDEFLILACDGLWDVCTDQEAVDIVRSTQDPQLASKQLVDHALARFSTDNLSCMIVRFDREALKQRRAEAGMGVDGDSQHAEGQAPSEATKIVEQAKKGINEAGGGASSIPSEISNAEPTEKAVEMSDVKEEPAAEEEEAAKDGPESNVQAAR